MADLQKRAKRTRKQATKRVSRTRKAAAKTTTRTRVQALAGFVLFSAISAAVTRVLRRGGQQRYSDTPDNLPNTPDRAAGVTPAPAV